MAEATRDVHDNKEILGLRCDNQTTANADILRAVRSLSCSESGFS